MNIEIDNFNGPLDLLLHLIKTKKKDIYNINIEEITKEYLNYINNNDLSIDANSEYLVMASELIHLKSKMLLHQEDDTEEDNLYDINTEEELQRRLIEYDKIKSMSSNFKELEEKRSEVFTKLPSNLSEFRETNIVNSNVSLDDLLKAFEEFLKRQKLSEPSEATITRKELSLEERSSSIRNILKVKNKVKFLDLFDNISKPYVIITFLSILDMTKANEIIITQKNNFGDIFIERSNLK
jgi:segregation and condensation protein A